MKAKFSGNFPVYPNYPNIYQVQTLLNPENSNYLKKIIRFTDIDSNIKKTGIFLLIKNWNVWYLHLSIVCKSTTVYVYYYWYLDS